MIQLRGMTWDHPRGVDPLVAHAKLYEAAHGTRITWEGRSLEAFEMFPLDKLAREFDLLVIDHPHVGMSAASGCLLPLNPPPPGLTVGRSHESYHFQGKQWAWAIDAAAQVSVRRKGAMSQWPSTWDEVMGLAREHRVVCPLAVPVHVLMCFLTLCANSGHPCATSGPQFVESETAERTFEWLREFVCYLPNYWLERNPIVVYDWLLGRGGGGHEQHIYSPLIYGYVTYSLRPANLEFGDIPGVRGSVLGGTGIAVSAYSPHRDAAVAAAHDLASEATQRGIYAQAGGQPAHRAAWTDDAVNTRAENFFRNTIATLDASYLRPRFDGYIAFQRQAGALVGACIEKVITIASAVDRLNDAFARAQGLLK